jgi:hypothetical protein
MVATLLRSTRILREVLECVPGTAPSHEFADGINATDMHGTTAIMLAAITGNIKKVELLLEKGAWSNRCDAQDKTPLEHALEHQHVHMIDVLLPAMVREGDSDEWKDLFYGNIRRLIVRSVQETRYEGPCRAHIPKLLVTQLGSFIIDSLLESEESTRALVYSCMVRCRWDVLEILVKSCASKARAKILSSVVSFTCGCGKGCEEETVRICTGLDTCFWSLSPGYLCPEQVQNLLRQACRHEHPSPVVMKRLLHSQASHIGVCAASDSLVDLMRNYSQNTVHSNDPNLTARVVESVALLLGAGADMSTVDELGHTPLHYAVFSLNVTMVTYILAKSVKDACSAYWGLLEQEKAGLNRHTLILRGVKKYQVDVEKVIADIRSAPSTMPWSSVCCLECLDCKLQGMMWVLDQWSSGGLRDLAGYLEVLNGALQPDGSLQFREVEHSPTEEEEEEVVLLDYTSSPSSADNSGEGDDGVANRHGGANAAAERVSRWYDGLVQGGSHGGMR